MITARNLSKSFGSIRAVDGLTLEIPAGQTLVLQGPSGSGKTTLLRLVAGLEIPDEGEVALAGSPVSRPGWATPPHSRGIGMVFQRSALWPHMTVAQNILFGVTGISREQAALQLRTLLVQAALEGLAERFPAQLSGGEARRVALARALAAAPQRLLFDEPLTSQDPELKGRLLETIRGRVRESGATLVYVTHDAAEARQVEGRIVRMNRGRLEAD